VTGSIIYKKKTAEEESKPKRELNEFDLHSANDPGLKLLVGAVKVKTVNTPHDIQQKKIKQKWAGKPGYYDEKLTISNKQYKNDAKYKQRAKQLKRLTGLLEKRIESNRQHFPLEFQVNYETALKDDIEKFPALKIDKFSDLFQTIPSLRNDSMKNNKKKTHQESKTAKKLARSVKKMIIKTQKQRQNNRVDAIYYDRCFLF
jgi:hypothetical protein